jgi:hypothetical protein
MPTRHLGPLDAEPVSVHPPYGQRQTPIYDSADARLDRLNALREPLAEITLGAYDRRMLDWLALWDIPTVATVASLLHRARAAAPLDQVGTS